nr:hypothetical protein StreXyl84_08520 [Streptomyces sp. Xyl84]
MAGPARRGPWLRRDPWSGPVRPCLPVRSRPPVPCRLPVRVRSLARPRSPFPAAPAALQSAGYGITRRHVPRRSPGGAGPDTPFDGEPHEHTA